MKKTLYTILLIISTFLLNSCSKNELINLGSNYFSFNIYKTDTNDISVSIPIIMNKGADKIVLVEIDDENNKNVRKYALNEKFDYLFEYNGKYVYQIVLNIKTNHKIDRLNINNIELKIDEKKYNLKPKKFTINYYLNEEDNLTDLSIRERIIINPVFPKVFSLEYNTSDIVKFNYIKNGLTEEEIKTCNLNIDNEIKSGQYISKNNSSLKYNNIYSETKYTKNIYNHLISVCIDEMDYYIASPIVQIYDYSYDKIKELL
ncbi:hypothetical protein [Haploplasma axanthum]|uniref:Uncharacterized protein n=1 Tax=Haploplasma axanthum TaxID=29552 RepID=A0A449BDM6_HAPAX|nr:hypothetical protein [Haploplasma axanthum]VEU80532.1 Uncharacterised protein [Haploplasma axanthum]